MLLTLLGFSLSHDAFVPMDSRDGFPYLVGEVGCVLICEENEHVIVEYAILRSSHLEVFYRKACS